MPGPLLPDRDEMLKFVDVMFKNAHSEGFISLRIFPDKGSKNDKPLLIQSLRLDDYQFEELLLIPVELAANWNPPPAVFAPPVCTFKNRHSAKTENILEGIVLSVECDATPNTARGLLEALLGPATIVVESGGEWVNSQTGEIERKVHLHWRLKQAAATLEELAALYEARGLATALVGADTSCISIVHPLRWPGSWHCKATPKLARIAAISEDTEIDLATVLATLREAARKAGHAAPGRAPSAGNGAHGPAGGSGQPVHRSIIAQALAVIPNDSALLDAKGIQLHGWNFWNTVGMTIWASTGGSEEGRALFHEWSAKAAIYNEANTNSRWDHFATSPPSRLSFGSLVYRARQVDPDWEYQHVDPALVASIGKFLAEMELEHDEADDEGDDTEDAAAPGGGTGTSSGTSSGTGTSNSSQTEPTDLWGKFDPPDFPLGQVPKVIEDFALDRAATQGADVERIRGRRTGGLCGHDHGRDQAAA